MMSDRKDAGQTGDVAMAAALVNQAAQLRARGAHAEAIQCLVRAVQQNPDDAGVWFQLGQYQMEVSRADAALRSYRKALSIRPDFPECNYALALLLSARGDYDEALVILQSLLVGYPAAPDLVAALACLHEFRGDRVAAMGCMRPALLAGQVNLKLATVHARCARSDEEHSVALDLLKQVMARPGWPEPDQRDACYAAADLHDRLGQYTAAMELYHRANRLERVSSDMPALLQEFARLRAGFPVRRMERSGYAGNSSSLPVFIVGMPRSGTSLIEQVLASHSAVYGAGELDDMARLVSRLGRLAGTPYPGCLQTLPAATLDELASGYLDRLSALGAGAQRVIDKMPHNFLALGLIDLLFPGARVIHCIRDPRDTCLSIYFRHFSANHPYATDLHALGRYYREYASLMRYWKSVLRVPILDVAYEDMVDDPETTTRTLLAFCGLDWQEQCLHYHENRRLVTTPTYRDVRQPLYRSSLARWEHYHTWLADLHAGLGPEWPGEEPSGPEQA